MSDILIRLTAGERKAINAAAKKAGRKVADFCRAILLGAVGLAGTGGRSARNGQKLTDDDRARIREAAELGVRQVDLAKKYNVSQAAISRVISEGR